jgi:uncharacterized membrane protein
MTDHSSSKSPASVRAAVRTDVTSSAISREEFPIGGFEPVRSLLSSETELSIHAWKLAGILSLLVVSRFAGLTHQSLWYDEGYTAALGSASNFHEFWSGFGNFTTSEHLQPLYYLLMFLWCRVAGVSDAALRAPSAFFSIASGIAAYFALNVLAGGRRKVVLLGSTALVASSFSLYYAQEARPYALLQFLAFLLLATFFHNRVADEEGRSSLAAQIGFCIACSLCFLGSPFTMLLVLCLAVSDLAVSLRIAKRWFRLWALPMLVAVVSFLGYLIPAVMTMPSFLAKDVTFIRQPLWMNISYAVYGVAFGTTLRPDTSLLRGPEKLHVILAYWPVMLPAAVTLVLLAVGAYLLIRNAWRLSPYVTISLISLCLYVVVLFGFFGAIGRLNVLPRHASALFALLLVAIASAGTLATHATSTAGRTLLTLGLGGWLALNCISIAGYFADPASRKDDYRAAAAVLSGYSIPIYVVAGQPQLLARYGAATRDATATDPAQLAKWIEANSGRAAQIVLVFNQFRNYRWDATSLDPAKAMAPAYACQQVKHVSNIDLYVCRYLSSKQVSSSGPEQESSPLRWYGVLWGGRTEVRSLGVNSRL